MNVFHHPRPSHRGKTGLVSILMDGRARRHGWTIMKKLILGIADNTIVGLRADNGAEVMSWLTAHHPLRGAKATNWEGGYRTPCLIRWPGVIKRALYTSDFFAHEDLLPTSCAGGWRLRVVSKWPRLCGGCIDLQSSTRRI